MARLLCRSGVTVVLALVGAGCSPSTFGQALEGGGLFGSARCVPLAVTPARATPIQAREAAGTPCPDAAALRSRLEGLLRRGYVDRVLRLGQREMRRCPGLVVSDVLDEARDELGKLPANPAVALREARAAEQRGDKRAARRFHDAALRTLERDGVPMVVPEPPPEPTTPGETPPEPEPIKMLRFSLDGTRLVLAGYTNDSAVFDLEESAPPRIFRTTHQPWILDVSPDGSYVAQRAGSILEIHETGTGRIVRQLGGHEKDGEYTEEIDAAAFFWDSQRVATGDDEGTLRIFGPESGTKREFRALRDNLEAIAPSPDGRFIATAFSSENAVRIRSVSKGETYALLPTPSSEIRHLTWSTGGRHLLAGGLQETLLVWDLATCAVRRLMDKPPCHRYPDGSCGTDSLFAAAVSPDGSRVAGAFHEDGVYLWDTHTGARLAAVPLAARERGWDVTFSHDGSLLAAGTTEGAMLFRVNEGGERALDPLVRIALLPEGAVPVVFDVRGSPPDAPPAATGSFDTPDLARAPLTCRFGLRRAPLQVCADRLHVPGLLARRARGLPADPLDVDPSP